MGRGGKSVRRAAFPALALWQLLLCSALDADRLLYTDVRPVNTSHCLDVIDRLPLRHYIFKYESRSGRPEQLGVIGDELSTLLPEAVEIVASRPFPNSEKGKPPIVVKDLAVVDKNVLFMYNVGASKALADKQSELEVVIDELRNQTLEQKSFIERVQGSLEQQASEEAKEKLRLDQAEAERRRLELALEQAKVDAEMKAAEIQSERDKRRAEEELAAEVARLEKSNRLEMERTMRTIKANEEAAANREEMRARREIEIKEKELEQLSRLEALRREGELEKVRAEAQARADAERANEDLVLHRMRVQAEEDRKRALETVNVLMEQLAKGFTALLDEPKRLVILIGLTILFFALYYAVHEALSLTRQLLESKIGKPKLVRETSKSLLSFVAPSKWLEALALCKPLRASRDEVLKYFRDVVLPPELQQQVYRLAVSTRNAKANQAPYRHLLLHGKPGTGKTMVAKRLAQSSGMDYAVISGGDVGPLGADAVSELHKLFGWADKSQRGLLLFIDEAEAFLSARGGTSISEERRNALNALLYQTGQQSYRFMMVLATNRPQDLDAAVVDRIDDYLGFPLPSAAERKSMIQLYYEKLVVKRGVKGHETVSDEAFTRAAASTEGFSGREISKLMLSVLNAVFGTADGAITLELFEAVVRLKAGEHRQKEQLMTGVVSDTQHVAVQKGG